MAPHAAINLARSRAAELPGASGLQPQSAPSPHLATQRPATGQVVPSI